MSGAPDTDHHTERSRRRDDRHMRYVLDISKPLAAIVLFAIVFAYVR